MLKNIFNQYALLKSLQCFDSYNNPVFAQEIKINCKFEFSIKEKESKLSELKMKPARMFCSHKINVGDVVIYNSVEFKVSQVNEFDDLDGNYMFSEVFLL